MERYALLLVSGRGVPCKDHKRAVQLMHRALSHISSGQSKLRGVQALLKQLVLSYRILFVRLCDVIGRLSFCTVQYAVKRIANRIALLNSHDRLYPTESPNRSANVLEEQSEVEVGALNESDRFLRSAITFPTVRYLSEESAAAAGAGAGAGAGGAGGGSSDAAVKVVSVMSDKRSQRQGQAQGQGQVQGKGQEEGQTQGQKTSTIKAGEDDWGKWMRRGRPTDAEESGLASVTSTDRGAQTHSNSNPQSAKSK
jgi:hypothetical protein